MTTDPYAAVKALPATDVISRGLKASGVSGTDHAVEAFLEHLFANAEDDADQIAASGWVTMHIDLALGPQGPVQTDWRTFKVPVAPAVGSAIYLGDDVTNPDEKLTVANQLFRVDSQGGVHVHVLCTKMGAAVVAASPSMMERLNAELPQGRAPGSRLVGF